MKYINLSLLCLNLAIFLTIPSINSKLLVLIISSDYCPIDECFIYKELQKVWRLYMHYGTKNVESYFIKGNINLGKTALVKEDIIWSKTDEGWSPVSAGILNKTILSLEYLESRLNEFDFVLRTNLSSFYVFPKLLEYLKVLPKQGCYCGSGDGFASGCGFIMSSDVAGFLVKNKAKLIDQKHSPDDVIIGQFLTKYFKFINHPRLDILNSKSFTLSNLDHRIFQFRIKNNIHKLRISEDLEIYKILLAKFYNILV